MAPFFRLLAYAGGGDQQNAGDEESPAQKALKSHFVLFACKYSKLLQIFAPGADPESTADLPVCQSKANAMSSEFEQKLRELFLELGRNLESLFQKAGASKEEIDEALKKRIEELKRSRDAVEREIDRFRESNAQSFTAIENNLRNVSEEVKKILDDLLGGKKKS